MTNRRLLGYTLVALPFIGIYVTIGFVIGWVPALLMLLTTATIVGCILGGVHLSI